MIYDHIQEHPDLRAKREVPRPARIERHLAQASFSLLALYTIDMLTSIASKIRVQHNLHSKVQRRIVKQILPH
jgi:hypothetical protein